MLQVVLNIKDASKKDLFLKLVQELDFVEVVNGKKAEDKKAPKLTRKQAAFVDGLKEALKEVELHQQGKIKLKTLDELIKEL